MRTFILTEEEAKEAIKANTAAMGKIALRMERISDQIFKYPLSPATETIAELQAERRKLREQYKALSQSNSTIRLALKHHQEATDAQ